MSHWIPCSAANPKREVSSAHSEWVLVTSKVEGARLVWFAQYGHVNRTWYDPEGQPVPGVTAWRKLPRPFDESMSQRQWPAARSARSKRGG